MAEPKYPVCSSLFSPKLNFSIITDPHSDCCFHIWRPQHFGFLDFFTLYVWKSFVLFVRKFGVLFYPYDLLLCSKTSEIRSLKITTLSSITGPGSIHEFQSSKHKVHKLTIYPFLLDRMLYVTLVTMLRVTTQLLFFIDINIPFPIAQPMHVITFPISLSAGITLSHYQKTELIRSLRLGNVWVFLHLILGARW